MHLGDRYAQRSAVAGLPAWLVQLSVPVCRQAPGLDPSIDRGPRYPEHLGRLPNSEQCLSGHSFLPVVGDALQHP